MTYSLTIGSGNTESREEKIDDARVCKVIVEPSGNSPITDATITIETDTGSGFSEVDGSPVTISGGNSKTFMVPDPQGVFKASVQNDDAGRSSVDLGIVPITDPERASSELMKHSLITLTVEDQTVDTQTVEESTITTLKDSQGNTRGGSFINDFEQGGGKGAPEDITQKVGSAPVNFNNSPSTSKLMLDLRGMNGGVYAGNINTATPFTSDTLSTSVSGSNTALGTTNVAVSPSSPYPRAIFKSMSASLVQPTANTTVYINIGGFSTQTYFRTGIWTQSYSNAGNTFTSSRLTTPYTSFTAVLGTTDTFNVFMWNTADFSVRREATWYNGTTYQSYVYNPFGLNNWSDTLSVQVTNGTGAAPTAAFSGFTLRASAFRRGFNFTSLSKSISGGNFT